MPPKGKTGTRGQKQIVEENKSTLVFYRNILLLVNAVFFSTYVLLFWEQYTSLPITMSVLVVLVSWGSYLFMGSMGQARYSEEGSLLDSGVDLNMEAGMAEHLKDVILLSCIVQALSLLSNYFWLLLLLIPGRATYMLWVNILAPWFFAEAPEEPVDDKKAKKMERKMKRLQR